MDDNSVSVCLVVIRLALGLMLMAHGLNKIFGEGGITGTARWFDGLGLRPGIVHARLAATTELGSGALMALGLFFPAPCAGFVGLMSVAAVTEHRGKGFFIFKNGWEYVALVGLVAAGLGFAGAGRWSLDHVIGISLHGVRWGTAAVVVGVVAGLGMVASFRQAHVEDAP